MSPTNPYVRDRPTHSDHTGLDIHKTSAPLLTFAAVRYPATYPRHPPALKMTATEGLDIALIKSLMHALNEMAAQHAKEAEVCAFNLVDRVQEVRAVLSCAALRYAMLRCAVHPVGPRH